MTESKGLLVLLVKEQEAGSKETWTGDVTSDDLQGLYWHRCPSSWYCRICCVMKDTSHALWEALISSPLSPQAKDPRVHEIPPSVTQPAFPAVRCEVSSVVSNPVHHQWMNFLIEKYASTRRYMLMRVVKMRRVAWEQVLLYINMSKVQIWALCLSDTLNEWKWKECRTWVTILKLSS